MTVGPLLCQTVLPHLYHHQAPQVLFKLLSDKNGCKYMIGVSSFHCDQRRRKSISSFLGEQGQDGCDHRGLHALQQDLCWVTKMGVALPVLLGVLCRHTAHTLLCVCHLLRADQALSTLAMRKFCEDKVSPSLQPSQNRYQHPDPRVYSV